MKILTINAEYGVIFLSFSIYLVLLTSQQTSSQIITKPIISFCTGGYHTCAVFNDKRMKCWGQRYSWGSSLDPASVGDTPETVGNNITYIDVGISTTIDKVSCGSFHTCIRLNTGAMKCLGGNSLGESGVGVEGNVIGSINGYIGDKLPSVNFGNGLEVLDFSLGFFHTCAILTGNKVKCFGSGSQLGLGDGKSRGSSPSDMGKKLPFVDFGTGVEVASVHAQPLSSHTCVILSKPTASSQRIKCWGNNNAYQLGYGDNKNRGNVVTDMGNNLPLVDLGTESRVKQLALGNSHTCVILVDDVLKCWGNGYNGQLGSGSSDYIFSTGSSMPSIPIDSGNKVGYVTAGFYHTCIVYNDMTTMKCVGDNSNGQLGQGDILTRGNTPTSIFPSLPAIDLGTELLKIKSIHGGYSFTCVVFENNSVKCFGNNINGQAAIGSSNLIGDEPGEMGGNLTFAIIFSPNQSPTQAPVSSCNYPTKKKCRNDSVCQWNQGVCSSLDCTLFVNKSSCKANNKCVWKNNSCESKV